MAVRSRAFDVVIVGGGMGGLALALALAQRGRTVALIERQNRLSPPDRGELLQPNGLRILDRLGLLESLEALPIHRAHRFHFIRIGGRRLCTVDYRNLPPPWNYSLITLPRHLLGLLMQKIEQSDRISLLTGTEFQRLLLERGRVTGIVAHGGEEGGEVLELRAQVVVGSDGAGSRVRESLGIRADVHSYREAYITMVVPRSAAFDPDVRYYVGRAEILGLFPISERELYLFYMIPANRLDPIRKTNIATVCEKISRIDSRLTESLKSIESWKQVGYMSCTRVRAERWTADHAALIGDAAHAMNPHVAQGRNQALEDAMALADVIQDCFGAGDFTKARLDRFEKGRRPSVERLQRMGDELNFLWNARIAPLAWLRDRIFEGMDRHPEVRQRVVKTISGLDIRPLGLFERLRVFMP